jgi:diacylglycerol kinase family enzyme
MDNASQKVFVVFNPKAGKEDQSDHDVMEVDALKVGKRHFFSNVSVGISPEVMNDTSSAEKKQLGRLAYIISMIKRSSIFQLQRYTLTLDGQPRSIRAAEVMVSNTTLLVKPPAVFRPPETLDDGQLEVYLVMAQTPGDYMRLVWACSAGRASRRRSSPTWPPRTPFALRPTVPIWSRQTAK